jgi:hypothetical protein
MLRYVFMLRYVATSGRLRHAFLYSFTFLVDSVIRLYHPLTPRSFLRYFPFFLLSNHLLPIFHQTGSWVGWEVIFNWVGGVLGAKMFLPPSLALDTFGEKQTQEDKRMPPNLNGGWGCGAGQEFSEKQIG